MAGVAELPRVRSDLVVQQLSDQEFVVKLRARREYFSVGSEEAFLLQSLQQPQTEDSLVDAFEGRFGDRLSRQDVRDFLELIRKRRLLEAGDESTAATPAGAAADDEEEEDALATNQQSLLFYRIPICDPNDKFERWERRLWWIWTVDFLIVSVLVMLAALAVLWSSRGDLVSSFPAAMRWDSIAIAWAVVIATTALHEMAHGMTCRHFGGEVHDTGVLFMFFMPCLYCNVSDAWLIREKWKRLWITAAGGYCDLCVWALSVFIWRVTAQHTLINYLAFVALTVCGARSLLNFNPLLRLDGYYLLSDWLSMPNLRKRAQEYWMAHLRWLLWGAARPASETHGWFLLAYGAMGWFFAIVVLDLIFIRMLRYSSQEVGPIGVALTSLLGMLLMKRIFNGFFRSEFMTMLTERKGRVMTYAAALGALVIGSFIVPVKNNATGKFEVRPGERHQVASPAAGYVRAVFVADGESVAAGAPLLQLESPDLEHQIAVKRSELEESQAQLAKLRAGTRPEELADQSERVRRLEDWCAQGRQDVARAQLGLEQELIGIDQRMAQTEAELQFAEAAYQQSGELYRLGAVAGSELRQERTRLTVLQAQIRQYQAERRARETEGVRRAETELAQREQQLADARARLRLMEAGARPEEIAAEQARRDRLAQELAFLEDRRNRLVVRAPVDGVVATPRIHEQVGTLAAPGASLCVVEDSSQSFIEIAVSEEDVIGLKPGQPVSLKARALPFETFQATVDRIAPSASGTTDGSRTKGTLVVYCRLDNANHRLRTGMSGFGRIDQGWNSLGVVLVRKALSYLRTEFWW